MCSHLMLEQIIVALKQYILRAGSRCLEKVCTYKLEPSEDLTQAKSLNIASLSKDRHFCVFCLSLIRKYAFLLLTALTLTLPGKKRNIQASIINCLWLWMKVNRHVLRLYSDGFVQPLWEYQLKFQMHNQPILASICSCNVQ